MILFLFLANFPFDKSKFSPGGITSIKLWVIRLAWSWNWFDSPILPSPSRERPLFNWIGLWKRVGHFRRRCGECQ